MAKSKTIDEAIDKLLDNYEDVIIKAARYATDETCKEIYQYSMSCLEEYYESYIPSSYERTDYLWHAILPYAEHPRKVGNNIVSTVGVEYDSTKLDGVYNGSQKYRPVDGDWVLDNYLKGIHPIVCIAFGFHYRFPHCNGNTMIIGYLNFAIVLICQRNSRFTRITQSA